MILPRIIQKRKVKIFTHKVKFSFIFSKIVGVKFSLLKIFLKPRIIQRNNFLFGKFLVPKLKYTIVHVHGHWQRTRWISIDGRWVLLGIMLIWAPKLLHGLQVIFSILVLKYWIVLYAIFRQRSLDMIEKYRMCQWYFGQSCWNIAYWAHLAEMPFMFLPA